MPPTHSATSRPACSCSAPSSRRTSTAATQQDIIDDIDFFLFPEVNPTHGQDAIEAPIDGFMMAAEPKNEDGAKALLTGLGAVPAIDAYISVNPAVVAANDGANTATYNALQQKSAEAVGSAKYIAQFLDRDTDPDFAANVVGQALADFIAAPDASTGSCRRRGQEADLHLRVRRSGDERWQVAMSAADPN